ncbi:hypothetical protein BD769DRAFT_1673208 [Suillus cothurnatus]|nr:hypothetical protein BD769DRAFT_1673208 [Suillus cothurnatus]
MITTQVLGSVPSVCAVLHAKIESLLAPVTPKCKALDVFPESSMTPRTKKCKFPAAHSKCKADEEIPQGTLPPSFKKLCHSYAIADLTAHSTNAHLARRIPQEHSKHKAYGDTPNDSLPPSFKRRTFSRSYVIANLLAHSATEERSIDPVLPLCGMPVALALTTWLRVNAQTCLALLLYTRMTSFCAPRFLHCDLHGTGNHDLSALKIFLQSLKEVQDKPISSVICFDAPPGVDLASLFQLVKDLGCSSFRYSSSDADHPCTVVPAPSDPSAVCCLWQLSIDSPIFFSPCVASLTLVTLRDSQLIDLSLTHTRLSAIQWAALLRNVHLPLLRMLTVDIECPPDVLAKFFSHHQNVGQLWIHPGPTLSPKSQNYSSQVSKQPLQHIPNSCLLHLNVLGGLPWYLISLQAIIHSAPCILKLSLRFEEDFTFNYLSAVLDIARHFASIQELQLSFFDASHTASHFEVPCDEVHTVASKQLTISVHGPDPDILLFSCRPWLEAFHKLESVELQAKCTSLEKLEELFSSPDNSFQLKISSTYL